MTPLKMLLAGVVLLALMTTVSAIPVPQGPPTCAQLKLDIETNGCSLNYELMENLVCTGDAGFIPICAGGAYSGTFEGNGHTITDLTVVGSNYVGLFADLNGATIQNLVLQDFTVAGAAAVGTLTGHANGGSIQYVDVINTDLSSTNTVTGGLVGYVESTDINYCTVTGTIFTTTTSDRIGGITGAMHAGRPMAGCHVDVFLNAPNANEVGGLIGNYDYIGPITDSSSTGTIMGKDYVGGLIGRYDSGWIPNMVIINSSYSSANVSGEDYVGGLIGLSWGPDPIHNSYATGTVTATGTRVGGLVGHCDESKVYNSYASGDVSGNDRVGGLLGELGASSVENSYSTGFVTGPGAWVGGFIGLSGVAGGFVENCGWFSGSGPANAIAYDGDHNGPLGVTYSEGDPTVFMDTATTHAIYNSGPSPWDFGSIWDTFCDDTGYPPLQWQGVGNILDCPGYEPPCPTGVNGGGTEGDPCVITDCDDLQAIDEKLDAYYVLSNDIDCDVPPHNSGAGFDPIGDCGSWCSSNTQPFTGSFDGLGHTISGLHINRPSELGVALFSMTDGDVDISNVVLEDMDLTGEYYTAGLVGWNDHTVTIDNCHTSGLINAISGYGGGLIGSSEDSDSSFHISDSSAIVNFSGFGYDSGGLVGYAGVGLGGDISSSYAIGTIDNAEWEVGGLVGAGTGLTINDSYADVDITGVASYALGIGGLVGYRATINRCYAKGDVHVGAEAYAIGGLVGGAGSISNSFFTGDLTIGPDDYGGIGSVLGDNTGVANSYWNDHDGNPDFCANGGTPAGCTPIDDNEAYFYDVADTNPPFDTWDFDTVWSDLYDDIGFPHLAWEVLEPVATNFTGGSTDFSAEENLSAVDNMTLETGDAQIVWDASVNASNQNFDENIEFGPGFVSVDSGNLDDSINSSATVTINGVVCPVTLYYGAGTYATSDGIIGEANICDDTTDPACTNVNCFGGMVIFDVSHFTGFAAEDYVEPPAAGVVTADDAGGAANFGDITPPTEPDEPTAPDEPGEPDEPDEPAEPDEPTAPETQPPEEPIVTPPRAEPPADNTLLIVLGLLAVVIIGFVVWKKRA